MDTSHCINRGHVFSSYSSMWKRLKVFLLPVCPFLIAFTCLKTLKI